MGTKLENLSRKAGDVVDEKKGIAKRADINADDRLRIKSLLDSPLLDEDDSDAIQSVDDALVSDSKMIDEEAQENEEEREDLLTDIDGMLQSLRENEKKLEKMHSSSDLVSDSSYSESTHERIEKLKAIKEMLGEENDAGNVNQILQVPTDSAPSSYVEKSKAFSERMARDYGTSIAQKIRDAGSFNELNDIIKTEQIAKNCIWGNVDFEVAKEWTLAVFQATYESKFNKLMGTIPVIGTVSAAMDEVRRSLAREFRNEYLKRYPEMSAGELKENVRYRVDDYMSQFEVDGQVIAISVSVKYDNDFEVDKEAIFEGGNVTMAIGDNTVAEQYNGLLLNVSNQSKTIQQINDNLRFREEIGHAPKGCTSIKYVASHEIAHQIDDILKISSDTNLLSYYEKFHNCNTEKQKDLLCTYAATNIKEFVAEAYAEAMSSPAPRRIALYVKNVIDAEARKKLKRDEVFVRELERG